MLTCLLVEVFFLKKQISLHEVKKNVTFLKYFVSFGFKINDEFILIVYCFNFVISHHDAHNVNYFQFETSIKSISMYDYPARPALSRESKEESASNWMFEMMMMSANLNNLQSESQNLPCRQP